MAVDARAIAGAVATVTKRVRNFISRDRTFRPLSVLVGSTALTQLLSIVAAPILTRLYTPAEFGVLAVYGSTLSILTGVAALRYDLAITLPESEDAAASLAILSGAAAVVNAAVLATVLLLENDILTSIGIGALEPYWAFLPIGLCGAGLYSTLSYWAIRERAFGAIARTQVSRAGVSVLTQLGLGLGGAGAFGLLSGHLIAQSAGIGTLGRSLLRKEVLQRVSKAKILAAAKRYIRFPLVSSWGSLLNSAGLYLPAIALTALYGPIVAGCFALAERIVKVPLTLIGNSAAQVYMGQAAATTRQAPHGLRALFRSFALRLFALGLLPAAVFLPAGPILFGLVFGPEWTTAGTFARWLSLGFAVRLVASPLSQTLTVVERQGIQVLWEGSRLVCIGTIFWLAHVYRWSPGACVLAYSLVMAASYALIIALSWLALPSLAPPPRAGDRRAASEVPASSTAAGPF